LQGTTLAPTLFSLFINDLLIQEAGGEITTFADDSAIVLGAETWSEATEKATKIYLKKYIYNT